MNKIPIFLMFKDKVEWTELCLEYLRKNTNEDLYRLILINNGSLKSNSLKYKELIEDNDCIIEYIEEVSVPFAYNEAINKYLTEDDEFFVILHNDCFVSDGWLEKMLKNAKEENDFSVVFPRTNYSTEGTAIQYDMDLNETFCKNKTSNKVRMTKKQIIDSFEKTYEEYGGFDFYSERISESNDSYCFSDEICYFCALYNADLYREIGGFDDDFLVPSGDSKLYNYKTNLLNFYPIMSMGCFVHHHGNATTDSFNRDFHKEREDSDILYEDKVKESEEKRIKKTKINTRIKNNKDISLLFIRDDGIGDIIMSMFTLQAIKEEFPNIEITYATQPIFCNFVKNFECIEKSIEIERVNKEEFDIVFDFVRFFEIYNKKEYKTHRIEQVFNFVRKNSFNLFNDINIKIPKYSLSHQGVKFSNFMREYYDVENKYVAISPFGTCKIRSIPDRVYEKIIELESKKGKKVIILSKDKIHIKSENIIGDNVINLSGKTDVEDLPNIISKCEYIYSPDSGSFHIAGLVETPCVGFFGSIEPTLRDGFYKTSPLNRMYFKKDLECAPCWDVGCSSVRCMKYSDEEIERIVSGELLDNG